MDELDEELEGFKVPICRALTTDITVLGVPREMFILNVTFGVILLMGLGLWYLLFVSFAMHFVLQSISKNDPKVFNIYMKRYSKQKQYYGE